MGSGEFLPYIKHGLDGVNQMLILRYRAWARWSFPPLHRAWARGSLGFGLSSPIPSKGSGEIWVVELSSLYRARARRDLGVPFWVWHISIIYSSLMQLGCRFGFVTVCPFGYVAKRTFSANGLSNWLLPTNGAIMYLTVLVVLRTYKI